MRKLSHHKTLSCFCALTFYVLLSPPAALPQNRTQQQAWKSEDVRWKTTDMDHVAGEKAYAAGDYGKAYKYFFRSAQ